MKEQKLIDDGPGFNIKAINSGNSVNATIADQTDHIHETLEIGLLHTVNCDIKATEDMIKKKYLKRT